MKVSVLIPAFNHAAYLEEAILSVLNQSYSDFELLISDDHSDDGTPAVLRKYEKHPKVQAFFQKKHIGAVEQIHFLVERASGAYIALLNSDDYWRTDKLQQQVDCLETHPEMGACFTHAVIVDEQGKPLTVDNFPLLEIFMQPNRSRSSWINYFYHKGNCLCHPSILARAGIYKKAYRLNPGLRQLPDYDLWTRYVLDNEFIILQEPLTYYRKIGIENTSAWTAENEAMLFREQAWIRKRMIEALDERTFKESFYRELRRGEASGTETLCEKFFLLAKMGEKDRFMREQAIEYYLEHARNPAFSRIMSDVYSFSDADFFLFVRAKEAKASEKKRGLERIFMALKYIVKG